MALPLPSQWKEASIEQELSPFDEDNLSHILPSSILALVCCYLDVEDLCHVRTINDLFFEAVKLSVREMRPRFRLRLVQIDFYMSVPGNLDHFSTSTIRGQVANQSCVKVPVIRIFGVTPRGQKCCMHCHNVLPYFFVPLPPTASVDVEDPSSVQSYVQSFAVRFALSRAFLA